MRACPVSCLGGAGCPLRRVGVVEAEARRAAWSCDKDPLLTLLEAAERGDFGLDGVEDTLLSREPRLTALPLRRTDGMVVAALSAGCENTKRPLGERDRSLDVSGWCSSADSAVVCARCSWDTRSDAARAISLISPRDVPPVPDPDCIPDERQYTYAYIYICVFVLRASEVEKERGKERTQQDRERESGNERKRKIEERGERAR